MVTTQAQTFKFQRDLIAIVLCIFLMAVTADGSETTFMTSPSASLKISGKTSGKIATSMGLAHNPLSVIETKTINATEVITKQRGQSLQHLSPDFRIFDAYSELYFDDDLDGHFYGLLVNFDADTDYFSSEVYARLYLSLEGGPWELYYTTEVFTIFGDSSDDDYTVETELFSGYPTGYYDVLIELYDYDYGDLIAQFGPAETDYLDELPLEDQQKDGSVIVNEPIVSHSHGGGGKSSLLTVFTLLFILHVRMRGRRLTPLAN